MKISQIYVYPVKSLRGVSVPSAVATNTGFKHDRVFCLVQPDENGTLPHISIGRCDELCLFLVDFLPSISNPTSISVTYHPPIDGSSSSTEPSSIEISLTPKYDGLQKAELNMHKSPCTAYDMGDAYAAFFTEHLKKATRLIYIGDGTREVKGNAKPNGQSLKPDNSPVTSTSWWGLPKILGGKPEENEKEYAVGFADLAAFLVTTTTSLDELGKPAGTGEKDKGELDLDMTKLRPNIVVEPTLDSELEAFEEDFWREIMVGDTKLVLTANCGRCKSLNVDYNTGKQLPIEQQMLKRLAAKGRRIDPGQKYSPIFGRYGFVADENVGDTLAVGMGVEISKKNEERTVLYWPGLSTDPK